MSIVAVGVDLAKNVFAVHGVDESGKAVLLKPRVKRADLLPLLASLPPCLIGMEACSGAHHLARELIKHGHDARIMAAKLVAPFRDGCQRYSNFPHPWSFKFPHPVEDRTRQNERARP
jgi:transposase